MVKKKTTAKGARGAGGPIFKGKDKTDPACRYVGIVTRAGIAYLETRRAELAKLAGRDAEKVSDGDLFEYMARGVKNTREYLKAEK